MREWPRVALGELLDRSDDTATLNLEDQYHEVTIRLWGKGVVSRGNVRGSDVATTRRFVRTNQFILSKIDARNGAVGLVPPELDGAIVSNDFPSFTFRDSQRLDPAFMGWLARSVGFVELCKAASEGTTNRVRIKESRFLDQRIGLPPLPEQQAIVAHLDALADKTRQLIAHLDAIESHADRLLVSLATRSDLPDAERRAQGWTEGSLGDVLQQASDSVSVRADESYPNVGVLNFARGLFAKPPIDGSVTSASTLYRIRAGQFLYSRLFAFEGAYAFVEAEHDGAFVSNEFPTFDIDLDRASPAFLYAYFRAPRVWEAITHGSKGLGDRRQRVQPTQLLGHKLWLPPRGQLDVLNEAIPTFRALKARHTAIRAANASLLPATLERLFNEAAKGEPAELTQESGRA